MEPLKSSAISFIEQAKGVASEVTSNITTPEAPLTTLKEATNVKDFSSTKYINASKDFLESNSFIAKIAFLLLVIIIFVILIRLSISILSWFFTPSSDPYLIKGLG